ncbi:hypothetical protein [Sinimarinibacterium thermocellulolyticum]|uniref:Uncharacterized protein n=1 Tax=Sinimarinibacterium thermocellulolyticum TaxID=3170016 RepID=A0ABV2A8Z2_9GAMM
MDTRKPFILPHPGIAQEFDVLFADTEFSRLPLPTESVFAWVKQTELLSLGITCLEASVTPSGLYAVRPLDKKLRSRCTTFVIDEVLPHLEAVSPTARFRSSAELRKQLRAFLSDRRRATGKPPAIAVDWAGDAFLLGEALPPDIDVLLLEGMPSITRAMDTFFNEDYRRHNAFHDALALRHGFMDYLGTAGE